MNDALEKTEFEKSLKYLKNNLLALKTNYEACLWNDDKTPIEQNKLYLRSIVGPHSKVHLEYCIEDQNNNIVKGQITHSDCHDAEYLSKVIESLSQREDPALTLQDLQQFKLDFYHIISKVTQDHPNVRKIPDYKYPAFNDKEKMSVPLLSEYQGLHRSVATEIAKKNQDYGNNVLNAVLDICHNLLEGLHFKFDKNNIKGYGEHVPKDLHHPITLYFAEHLERFEHNSKCKNYMDKVQAVPMIVNEKLFDIANLMIESTNKALLDPSFQELVRKVNNFVNNPMIKGLLRVGAMLYPGLKDFSEYGISPKPTHVELIKRRDTFARQKKLIELHQQALNYDNKQTQFQALSDESKKLHAENTKQMSKQARLAHAEQLKNVNTQLDLLKKDLTSYKKIIRSPYLELLRHKPEENSKDFETWLREADIVWQNMVNQEEEKDEYDTLHGSSQSKRSSGHLMIPESQLASDIKKQKQKSKFCGIFKGKFPLVWGKPKENIELSLSDIQTALNQFEQKYQVMEKELGNKKLPILLKNERISETWKHELDCTYLQANVEEINDTNLNESLKRLLSRRERLLARLEYVIEREALKNDYFDKHDGAFHKYLRRRGQNYWWHDMADTFFYWIAYVPLLGMLWYKTMAVQRKEYVTKLEEAMDNYYDDPKKINELRQLIKEGNQASTPFFSNTQLSDNPKDGTLRAELKSFETGLSNLENIRKNIQQETHELVSADKSYTHRKK